MAKIFYGVAGEGCGHATRALSLIEHMPEHEFHVFTFGKAYDFLKTMNYPFLYKINGVMFSYNNNHVDYFKTTCSLYDFFKNKLQENINYISKKYDDEKPELFITDFEPSIPRTANQLGYKFISIDNQHMFSECDLSNLPFFLRMYCQLTGKFTKWLIPNPCKIIISTFHYDKLISDKDVVLTNGLLRKEMNVEPLDKGYVLVYLRDSVSDIILDSIYNIKIPCHIYGAKASDIKNELSLRNNFKFYGLSSFFIKDLINCKCLISTAGNQAITEARFYGKPILVVPEPGQYEQHLNAYYVNQLGIGQSSSANVLNTKIIDNFIDNFKPIKNKVENGVNVISKIINNIINDN